MSLFWIKWANFVLSKQVYRLGSLYITETYIYRVSLMILLYLYIYAYFTAGLTAFYMFHIYLLVFEGYFNVHFQNLNGKKKIHYIQYLCGVKKENKIFIRYGMI
ncbi:hypothetical protein AHAS_Ahas17G0304000 [Arachis hypogaea]